MRNVLILAAALAAVGVHGAANAQSCTCTGAGNTRILAAELVTKLLRGNTVCVPNGSGGWEAQEQHRANSTLWDYRKGGNDAVDPTTQVGTWGVSQSTAAIITHSYTGGSSYVYKVCQVAGSTTAIGFCPDPGGATLLATVKSGTGSGCP